MGRISLAATLGWVGAAALGLAAVVNPTEAWAGAMLLLTVAALLASMVGVALRGRRGGGWLGFAVFGWGYFLLLLQTPGVGSEVQSLSDLASAWAFEKANAEPVAPASLLPPGPAAPGDVASQTRDDQLEQVAYRIASERHEERAGRAEVIGRRIATLAFAGLGSLVGMLLARRPGARTIGPIDPPSPR